MSQGPISYDAPPSAEIAARQNEDSALRYLVTQRALYSRSKRWMGLRWFGMGIIAIAGPLVAVLLPSAAVIAGAVAGLWIFLGRTTLTVLERRKVDQAASVQELFDFYVFKMPSTGSRSTTPSLEEIRLIVGDDANLQRQVEKQKLRGWYPIDQSQDGLVSVAIAQRANASYADRLLKATTRIWTWVVAVWGVLLIGAAFLFEVSFTDFFLAMFLPVLPALLDVWEYRRLIGRAAKDRRDLARAIEQKLANGAIALQSQDVLVWQARLFDLRRDAPQVPNFVYRSSRKRNEAAMESAAQQLSNEVKGT